jgi:peptide chain release factor 1
MNKDEFEIQYSRGSGPGGQHRNKVETCVVIIHIPTGLREKCEDTRSKIKNKEIAMERLVARIETLAKNKKLEKQNELRKKIMEDKKAIRTYNYPRNEVVDNRTGKRANLKKVLDGDLDLLKNN